MKVLLISYFTSEKIVIHSVMTCPKAHSNTELEMHWNQLQMTPCEPHFFISRSLYSPLHTNFGLHHMTYFGQKDISRSDISKAW